jgi:hypothetical protein
MDNPMIPTDFVLTRAGCDPLYPSQAFGKRQRANVRELGFLRPAGWAHHCVLSRRAITRWVGRQAFAVPGLCVGGELGYRFFSVTGTGQLIAIMVSMGPRFLIQRLTRRRIMP